MEVASQCPLCAIKLLYHNMTLFPMKSGQKHCIFNSLIILSLYLKRSQLEADWKKQYDIGYSKVRLLHSWGEMELNILLFTNSKEIINLESLDI